VHCVAPQGIYVLQDNSFRWLLRLAPASALPDGSSRAEYLTSVAQPYLELPCGLIRGGRLSFVLLQRRQRGSQCCFDAKKTEGKGL
jgi:hypothetical protein